MGQTIHGWNFDGDGIYNEAQSLTYHEVEGGHDQYYIDLLSQSVNVMYWNTLSSDLLIAVGEDEDGTLTPYVINLVEGE